MTDTEQFKLNLPRQLKRLLQAAAKANSRSLSAEIVAQCRESFADAAPSTSLVGVLSAADTPEWRAEQVIRLASAMYSAEPAIGISVHVALAEREFANLLDRQRAKFVPAGEG